MQIQEICDILHVTRQGLYWLLKEHRAELSEHVSRTQTGRWKIDDEAVGILKKNILMNSPTLVIQEIEKLKTEIQRLKLVKVKGLYLQHNVKNVLRNNSNLDSETAQTLSTAIQNFNDQIDDLKIRKELGKIKKRAEMQIKKTPCWTSMEEFPDGWEDMYEAWEVGIVSSGDFIKWSGIKPATFFNKITEYRISNR